MENKLKYTELTYQDIHNQMSDIVSADPRYDNYRESAVAQTLMEIFAGTTDMLNYYIQRRSEECFFDTAQLKSSVISKARELAYDVTRPIPAKSSISMTLRGDIHKALVDNGSVPIFDTVPTSPTYKLALGAPVQIQVPYYSKFSGAGSNFVLLSTMTINITYDVWNQMAQGESYVQIFDADNEGLPITIVEGEIREKIIPGNTNPQVGSPFQIYKIEDDTFSNVYGNKDYFFNDVTQVYVGETKTDLTRYKIDRKSLLSWENMNAADLTSAEAVCLIRTANDETIEILFGDDKYAKRGPITRNDNIFLQYLSTKGYAANDASVVHGRVTHSGSIFTNTGVDITQYVSFEFKTNVLGGGDIESMDSIKYHSPKMFYSLDRLVTKDDYKAYLSSLTAPILVKNSVSWGEQEERDRYGKFALARMFNTVLFCVTASIYMKNGDKWMPRFGDDLTEAVLDNEYDAHGLNIQGYFNTFITKAQVAQLRRYVIDTTYSAMKGRKLSNNTWASIKNTYGNDNDAYLEIRYYSPWSEFASNVHGSKLNGDAIDTSVRISISDITVDADDTNLAGMTAVAGKINEALMSTKDFRGNASDNTNYSKEAFVGRYFDKTNATIPPKIIIWNEEEHRFELTFNERFAYTYDKSPCIISKIESGGFSDMLGLSDVELLGVSDGVRGTISNKIVQVVDDLESRSQISTKHIYISPIIHQFVLVGNIQIKSLFDREATKLEINNKLYEFFDLKNDFNAPLYISNIIEIIENHPAVTYANVKLEPLDITNGINNKRNNHYKSGTGFRGSTYNETLKKYSVKINPGRGWHSENLIKNAIQDELDIYLSKSSFIPEDWIRYFSKYWRLSFKYHNTTVELEKHYYDINNYISERTFYIDFVYPLYSKFKELAKNQSGCDPDSYTCSIKDGNGDIQTIPNYRKFIGYRPVDQEYHSDDIFDGVVSTDFSIVMSDIHKDFSYLIMANMLDSGGNIRAEYDANNRYVRGGYSLESELIQVNAETMNYTYDSK